MRQIRNFDRNWPFQRLKINERSAVEGWIVIPVKNACIESNPSRVSVLKNIIHLEAVVDRLCQNTVPNELNQNRSSMIMVPRDCKMLWNQLLESYYEKWNFGSGPFQGHSCSEFLMRSFFDQFMDSKWLRSDKQRIEVFEAGLKLGWMILSCSHKSIFLK